MPNNDFNISVNEYLPLRDVVFNTLKDAIIAGHLLPGERLLENQLSEKLGVSRTPIREALRKLELEGLVEMIPRKGAQVSAMSEKDIQNVLEIRASLEALSAKLACKRITGEQLATLKELKEKFAVIVTGDDVEKMAEVDEQFHDLIFRASHNEKLLTIILNLRTQIYRYRIAYLRDQTLRKRISDEHEDIYRALSQHNEATAEEFAARHIKNQELAITDTIRKLRK